MHLINLRAKETRQSSLKYLSETGPCTYQILDLNNEAEYKVQRVFSYFLMFYSVKDTEWLLIFKRFKRM